MGLTLSESVFLPGAVAPSGLSENFARTPHSADRSADKIAGKGNSLRFLIARLDQALRRFHGVHEFSARDDCLLRIALGQATGVTWLPDGIRLPPGTEIIDLHLWNEQLWRLPHPALGLCRAVALRRQIRTSLSELARHIEDEPLLHNVAAIRAQTALVPARRIRQLLRVALAFGFEQSASTGSDSASSRLARICQNLFVCALTWTFNPVAPRRDGLRREHCELWMSRSALIAIYGRRSRSRTRVRAGAKPVAVIAARYAFLKFGAPHPAVKKRRRLGRLSSPRPGAFND